MLRLWEEHRDAPAPARALAMLAAAEPSASADDLLDLPLGERDRRLLALHRAGFGDAARATCACPACEVQLEIDLSGLELPAAVAGSAAGVRPVDSRAMLAASAAGSPEAAEAVLRAHCTGGRDLAPETLDAELERLDPAADLRVELACPECGRAWEQPVEPDRLLWDAVAHRARRVLAEVDARARAYGWGEDEILALPEARRNSYLELVG